MYRSLQLLSFNYFWNLSNTQNLVHKQVTLFDSTVDYFSTAHLPYAVIGIICFLLFSILPTLLLVLYPTRLFRTCIGKCRLSVRHQAALQTFVEKFHQCYRDGLDGGRDMRSFSGLYFILRGVLIASHELSCISQCMVMGQEHYGVHMRMRILCNRVVYTSTTHVLLNAHAQIVPPC